MTKSFRTAGCAAAAGIIAAFAFGGPTFAEEVNGTGSAVRYDSHATAGTEDRSVALNDVSIVSAQANGTDLPIAVLHAVATVTDEPVSEAEEERPARHSLAAMVDDYASADTPDAERECLAIAIYYEAKSESLEGQLTVADVIQNRARSGRFPASICGVVKQRGQFSFVRGGRLPAVPRGSKQWRTAVAIAHIATQDLADGSAPRALFFHARHASPNWKLTRVASVGNHVFYR